MGLTVQEVLTRALKKLEQSSFQRFIEKLTIWNVGEQYKNILKGELTEKDPEHIAGLLIKYYKNVYGCEVTLSVLWDINEKKIWKELQHDLRVVDISGHGLGTKMFTAGDHFLDRHKQDLIKLIKNSSLVLEDLHKEYLLTAEERDNIMEIPDSEDRMRRLYDIVRYRNVYDKQKVYTIFYKYNPRVIDDLKMLEDSPNLQQHIVFLETHRLDMISRVIMVDPVLDDLRDQTLLKQKQYDLLYHQPSIRKKITELLDIVNNWGDYCKNTFFNSLCAHNPSIAKAFQRADKNITDPDSYSWDPHFASHQPASERDVRFATQIPAPVRGRKHFVDEHCWDLIRRIIMVDPVLEDLLEQKLLPQKQYTALVDLKTPQKKMVELYSIVRPWTYPSKDQLYLSLRQHNPPFIRVLEKQNQMLKWNSSNKGTQFQKFTLDLETGFSAGKHFLDKNKSGLINVIGAVDPVVKDLRKEGLLTEEQYHNILLKETPREKMAEIYEISDSFDNKNKDKVYLSVRTHNHEHIRILERISKPSLSVPEHSGDVTECREPMYDQEDDQIAWVAPGSIQFTITCSICMDIYKDPVTLICGHNYCLDCIEGTWDKQDENDTSCPICRRRFKTRPELNKNLVLCQIAEFCQPTKSEKKTHELCTYCTITPKPAYKQCLLCEALLCEDHLKVHSKQAEHVVLEPSESTKTRQCSIHGRILEYYCSQDSTCVCAHCCIIGDHKGHPVRPFREAMEIKKDKLRDTIEKLQLKKSEIEKCIKLCKRKFIEKEQNISEPGTDGVGNEEMREILRSVQGGLSIEEEGVQDLIQQLEAKRSRVALSIAHIKELCYQTDPFLVLQDQEGYKL
ncbi:uncharacterized protein LOC130367540 [Hyla sarda]|uniref:uncharacterized protein LOC130367540 n=1 Tax=Hyla sarda TaxID=327740 RepID=UPI0024C26625|nr:uncharacterized protein LOC130367540 [Hyla sarda]